MIDAFFWQFMYIVVIMTGYDMLYGSEKLDLIH